MCRRYWLLQIESKKAATTAKSTNMNCSAIQQQNTLVAIDHQKLTEKITRTYRTIIKPHAIPFNIQPLSNHIWEKPTFAARLILLHKRQWKVISSLIGSE